MDKFPEAFKRFEDALPDDINEEDDTYGSLKQQFERWQLFGMTKKQEEAFQIQLREYNIEKVSEPKRAEPIYHRKEPIEISRTYVITLKGHEHHVIRNPNGTFKKWLKE